MEKGRVEGGKLGIMEKEREEKKQEMRGNKSRHAVGRKGEGKTRKEEETKGNLEGRKDDESEE